jgi:hypothetical protein
MAMHQHVDTALAIGRVCAEKDDMRALLTRTGEVEPLDQFIEAVRASADVADSAVALHEALQRAGDAVGVLGGTRTAVPWAMGDARPVDVVLLCPRRRCARAETPDAGTALHCVIHDEPLRSERI